MRTARVSSLLKITSICCLLFLAEKASSQIDDPDVEDPFSAGLVCTSGGRTFVAQQPFLASTGNSEATRWNGLLESGSDGEYQLAAKFVGELQITVADQVRLRASARQPTWAAGSAFELLYGHHPIQIQLKPIGSEKPSVSVFWRGPKFRWEPVPPKYLWHEGQIATDFAQLHDGQHWLRALRCEACHSLPGGSREVMRAPALENVAASLNSEWLFDFFTEPRPNPDPVKAALNSVHGSFNPRQASHLMAWLRSLDPAPRQFESNLSGDAEAGERMLLTVGCLACHAYQNLGNSGPFAGGDLTDIANKRPPPFFSRWLANPASINANHRMPQFELSDEEIADLSTLLNGRSSPNRRRKPAEEGNADVGQALASANQCLACHASARLESPVKLSSLSAASDWSNSCLDSTQAGQPNYQIQDPAIRKAIMTYVGNRVAWNWPAGAALLAENNCFQCHARGDARGIAPVSQAVVARHPQLTELLAAMKPPPLDSVGDKLLDRVLKNSILRTEAPLRPWLAVRMPRFPLSDAHVRSIADHLIAMDRVPEDAITSTTRSDVDDLAVADRLVTSDGFGCTSCHAIGNVRPHEKTPLSQLAPSLSMPELRIRKVWFDRWVRNPARITSNMEMPSVQIPLPGVLDGDLDRQLNAVWNILNVKRFSPPDPSPTRIVNRRGDPNEPAAVLTDVLKLNGRKLIKPFLIGLPNGHNILFDLQIGRLAGWWTGDTARQRTQGKTWYWEPPKLAVTETPPLPDLVIVQDGEVLLPQRVGQFVTEPDEWQRIPDGIELRHRLHFASDSAEWQTVHITQRITGRANGWSRNITATGLSSSQVLGLRRTSNKQISVAGDVRADGFVVPAADSPRNALRVSYESTADVVTSGRLPSSRTSPSAQPLDVMPGFQVTRLPLRTDIMPISLGWKPNGDLLVGSLKGRVWMIRDSDGDALPDQMSIISDDLAAPYGIHGEATYVDVANKHSVIRLHDQDGDGQTERHEVIASGWGHTDDYHDWVVGLPKDDAGHYYISIPCQQDTRTEAAAHLRGRVLELVPQDAKAVRRYALRELSAGHRFPMGIARNRAGVLVVTDNQGNYNPFNELNHVLPGRHFGFINQLERKPNVAPPLTPPAIDIPHPWTRSVNGICFLESSADADTLRYGPFEGHLVGCEYDTRRLIRMSLEEVDGWLQGAAYPLAEAAADPAAGLQGPVNCGLAPNGDLYIANIRDSGWGGGSNTGSIVRIVPDLANLPAGIAEIKAVKQGFSLRFTRPVNRDRAQDLANYSVSSYRRISTPAYGGDDVDRRREKLLAVRTSPDGLSVELTLEELRAGFVYEFKLNNLAGPNASFYPAEAYYTLRRMR